MNHMEGGVHALYLLKPTKLKGKNPLDLQSQFIYFYNTLENRKVLLAFYHTDGETFVWYQDAKK